MLNRSKGSAFGGALIIAGTCIGGGMLALPILTGAGGLLPSSFLFLLCWLFMAATALLFVEVCLWMEGETNLVSMVGKTLGPWAQGFSWALYLFLFYSLTTAYCVGGGGIVIELLAVPWPHWMGSALFLVVFAPLVTWGPAIVDRVNRLLMVGMALSFAAFLFLGRKEVNLDLWHHMDFPAALWGLPVIFGSFGFQGTVPSLVHYMGGEAPRLRRAILWGSAIPFFTYVLWQGLILGIVDVPTLLEAQEMGKNAVQPLKQAVSQPIVYTFGQLFAIFALVSSFLGVTLGLKDFLADGFQVKKDWKGRLGVGVLTFLPPYLFSLLGPQVFLKAMHYAGGLGVALLLGLLPVLMVWRGRYGLKLKGKQLLGGGRVTLVLLFAFVAAELVCELVQLLGIGS